MSKKNYLSGQEWVMNKKIKKGTNRRSIEIVLDDIKGVSRILFFEKRTEFVAARNKDTTVDC